MSRWKTGVGHPVKVVLDNSNSAAIIDGQKVKGGDLVVHCHTNGTAVLTGGVQKIYEGRVEF